MQTQPTPIRVGSRGGVSPVLFLPLDFLQRIADCLEGGNPHKLGGNVGNVCGPSCGKRGLGGAGRKERRECLSEPGLSARDIIDLCDAGVFPRRSHPPAPEPPL